MRFQCHIHLPTPRSPARSAGSRSRFKCIRLSTSANSRRLKQLLLAGRLNSFTCPYCRNAGALATPFFYHDPDKELALLFIPMNLNAKEADQQKMIGRLTQQVLNNLAPEKRKAYLLQPQQFFNLKTLIETILQADGITPEMLAREEARLNFLQELVDTTDDASWTI